MWRTYHRKIYAVQATQIEVAKQIHTSDGVEDFAPGDWLVEENGRVHKCGDDIFRAKFELAMPPGER